jgi:hypothetical protein
MSAIIQASPLEKLSQEPMPTGDSCVLVIFGASGDLTKRKLIPGLYNLACEGCMNPQFEVLGIGRTPMSSEEFRKKTREAAAKSKDTRDFSESGWANFETRLRYIVGDINDPNFYPQLRIRLEEMEKNGSSPNHLFYVSTPASPYVERLIGSIRRECLDHVIVWNRRSLCRILQKLFCLLPALPNSSGAGQGRSGVESSGEARMRAHRSNSSGRRTSPPLPASGRLEIVGARRCSFRSSCKPKQYPRGPTPDFFLHPASRIRTPLYCLAASRLPRSVPAAEGVGMQTRFSVITAGGTSPM